MFRRTATIETPSATKDSLGGAGRTVWAPLYTDIKVMVQQHAVREITLGGGETAETDTTIFTLFNVSGAARGHRVTVDSMQVFLVLSARREGDNVNLFRIECKTIQ